MANPRNPAAPLFYSPPLAIRDAPADAKHFTVGRSGFPILMILIHHTGGVDSVPWLTRTSYPPVSTHRHISKAGVITKIVKDEDTAYTAGSGILGPIDPDTADPPGVARNFNQVSLHIELENMGTGRDPYPSPQLEAAAAQCVEWWAVYGFLGIYGHADLDVRKNDPRGFDWPDFWRRIDRRYQFVLGLRRT